MQIKSNMQLKISVVLMMTAWLFSSFELNQIISGEITAMFSLKIPNKQIRTLQELVDSKLTLIAFEGLMDISQKDDTVLKRIKGKMDHDNSWVTFNEMFTNESSIVSVSEGKSAMFFANTPLSMILIKHMENSKFQKNSKFYYLDDYYRHPYVIILCISMKLARQFRNQLNFR